MKKVTAKKSNKAHGADCTCSLCGQKYQTISFKGGRICESCIDYIKDSYAPTNDIPPEKSHRE